MYWTQIKTFHYPLFWGMYFQFILQCWSKEWVLSSIFSLYPNFLSLLAVSPTEIQASPNTNATLPCNVTFPLSVKGDKIDKSFIKVSWISNGSDIASFRKAATQIKEGFSWDTSGFVNGDFSLTILRAMLDLQGTYECTVSYNSTTLHSSNITFSILGMSLFSCWDLIWALSVHLNLRAGTKLGFFCFSPL